MKKNREYYLSLIRVDQSGDRKIIIDGYVKGSIRGNTIYQDYYWNPRIETIIRSLSISLNYSIQYTTL